MDGKAIKRQDYISLDDYFMSVAFVSARRSKDPRTQVGACIVNEKNRIVSTGYNGMPNECSDDIMPWGKSNDIFLDKNSYVCHAEMNAIMNRCNNKVEDCRIYVTLFPCINCSKLIVQSGLKEVIYLHSKENRMHEMECSKWMFDIAGIKYRRFQSDQPYLVVDFGKELRQTVLGKL